MKKKRRATAPASTADPEKVQKIDFDFWPFFPIFVSGSSMRFESSKTHRPEVNINRVMT
jgi:hypothetical protein